MATKTNHLTGKVSDIPATTGEALTEFNTHRATQQEIINSNLADEAEVALKKKTDAASGKQKLKDLGLTDDEVDAIIKGVK